MTSWLTSFLWGSGQQSQQPTPPQSGGGSRRRNNTVTLFHYTDEAGARAIQQSGKIKMANEHTHFGRGSYLTRMSPDTHSKQQIAKNNYRAGAKKNLERGRCDKVVEVKVPKRIVQKCSDNKRDVWRVANRDVKLKKCKDYSIKNVN